MMKRWLLPGLLLGLVWAGPALAVDSRGYDGLLKRHVHRGVVDYRSLSAPDERAVLKGFLAELAEVSLPAVGDRPHQIAALINAYNAQVIDRVLDGHSPATVWGRTMFLFRHSGRVFGSRMTLDHLEHQLLQKGYDEPRVHFALVPAALGSPILRSEAYDGKRLDSQLDEQERSFVNDPDKNHFDRQANRLDLSMIFQWHRVDFTKSAGSVLRYLARTVPPATAAWIAGPGVTVRFLPYDWSLNGTL